MGEAPLYINKIYLNVVQNYLVVTPYKSKPFWYVNRKKLVLNFILCKLFKNIQT